MFGSKGAMLRKSTSFEKKSSLGSKAQGARSARREVVLKKI